MMTKGLKGLALAALLASGAVAADSGVFVGIEGALIKSKADVTASRGDVSVSESESGTSQSLGLNVGYRFNPDHRVYVGYHTFLGDMKDVDAKAVIIGYSWTPKVAENFRALAGIHSGVTMVQDDIGETARDLTLGVRLGGIYEINEKGEIQFGVKYDQTKFDLEFIDLEGVNGDLKLKNTALFVGYNYKF